LCCEKLNFMTTKKEKVVRLFWQDFVKKFYEFCRENFGTNPSFDGSSPRDLAGIYDGLKLKLDDEGIEWNKENAIIGLGMFFKVAYDEPWYKENFMLFILNRHKDKIFFKMKKLSNGKQPANLKARVQAEFDRRYGSKGD